MPDSLLLTPQKTARGGRKQPRKGPCFASWVSEVAPQLRKLSVRRLSTPRRSMAKVKARVGVSRRATLPRCAQVELTSRRARLEAGLNINVTMRTDGKRSNVYPNKKVKPLSSSKGDGDQPRLGYDGFAEKFLEGSSFVTQGSRTDKTAQRVSGKVHVRCCDQALLTERWQRALAEGHVSEAGAGAKTHRSLVFQSPQILCPAGCLVSAPQKDPNKAMMQWFVSRHLNPLDTRGGMKKPEGHKTRPAVWPCEGVGGGCEASDGVVRFRGRVILGPSQELSQRSRGRCEGVESINVHGTC